MTQGNGRDHAGGTVFAVSTEELKRVRSEGGEILTEPFLHVCKGLLALLDDFGSSLAFVKTDVGGNIQKLESKYLSNPKEFSRLSHIVNLEVKSKAAKAPSSCTVALLWLTRSMDFLVQLFRNLVAHPEWSMSHTCKDSYKKTLKKWHGWVAASAFMVGIKLVPDRKRIIEVIGGSSNLDDDMKSFCDSFAPVLADIHKHLASVGHDNHRMA